MSSSDHGISLLAGNGEPIVVHFELMRSIVERESDARLDKSPVQIPGDRLSGPLGRIFKLLAIRRVGVGFGQEIPISVLVERVFGRVGGGRLAAQRRVLLRHLVLLLLELAVGVFGGLSLDAAAGLGRRLRLLRLLLGLFGLARAGRVIARRVEQRRLERLVVGPDLGQIAVDQAVFEVVEIRLWERKEK